MQTYAYACGSCGPFDLVRTIAQRGDPASCPQCGRGGKRVFTAPHLGRLDPALDRAATSAGTSAERPSVTTRIPAAATAPLAVQSPGHPPLPRS